MRSPIRYGTAYYPDHWPEEDWERDLKLIRESGLDLVRFGEFSWSWFEPREEQYDFRAYDRFMDLAQRCGLGVILCTPTCNPPQWFFARHPDARQLDQRGRPHVGHRHQACYNHPGARALAESTVTRLARHYRDHPALVGWQIDNELTAGESLTPAQVYDYHPETIKCYRAYLRAQYENLDALNEAWFNNYWSNRVASWDEIEPPRIGENRQVSPGAWVEWSRFRDRNVAALGQWQLAWLRDVHPGFVIGTNIPETGATSSIWLAQDYWALCHGMDFIGADLYVYRNDPEGELRDLAYSCDLLRSAAQAADARFGILETQGGPQVLPWRVGFAGGYWEPDFLRRSVETYAAHGADHILFFLWRAVRGGAEFGMSGMAGIDGSPSPRTRALPAIVAAGEAARDRLLPKPVAYIHYSQDSLRLSAQYDPDHAGATALLGWHGLLSDLDYRIEFLNDDALTGIETLPPGPLVMPYSLSLREELCALVARAAYAGRTVVAGYATAYFDQFGRIYLQQPGGGLNQALGVEIVAFDNGPLAPPAQVSGLSSPESVMRARVVVQDGHSVYADQAGRALVVTGMGMRYVAIDLGSLYQRVGADERASLAEWARRAMAL